MKIHKTSLLATVVLSGILALCSPGVNAHVTITPGHTQAMAADTGKMKKPMKKADMMAKKKADKMGMDKKKMDKMGMDKKKMDKMGGKMDGKMSSDTASKM